jgi:hypothetical protein
VATFWVAHFVIKDFVWILRPTQFAKKTGVGMVLVIKAMATALGLSSLEIRRSVRGILYSAGKGVDMAGVDAAVVGAAVGDSVVGGLRFGMRLPTNRASSAVSNSILVGPRSGA